MSDIILKPTDWNIQATKYPSKPGDRFVLVGDRKEIEFHNLAGTAENPIVVTALAKTIINAVNPGGRVVQFVNCQHVRLTGDPLGDCAVNIFIDGGAHAVDFRQLSSGVEVDHLDINTGYGGIAAKTDPTCDPKTWRGNFVLDGVHIHHNRISTKTGEGIYIGQSHYNTVGAVQGGPCASGVRTAPEHEVRNVVVEDNIITTSGADGIQVGSCPSGAVIRRNLISRYGTQNGYGQNAGIIVNPGTVADVYENKLDSGTGFAIQLQGPGGSKVHHNLILNPIAGAFFAAVYKCVGVTLQPDYQIYNNTVVNCKGVALQYYCPASFKNNVLQLASGAIPYKKDGSAGILTTSGNFQLATINGILDADYVPLATSSIPAGTIPAGVGYADYQKPPPVVTVSPALIEKVVDAGVVEYFLVTESGYRKKLE